jgi:Rhs element Vgr protein
MASSPIQQDLTLVSFSILIDGKEVSGEYHITEIEVKRELNKIPVATIVVLDGDPADVEFPISEGGDFVPGKTIKITAGYHQTEETIFEGVIASQGLRIPEDEMSELTIHCVATAAKLTTNRKNQFFAEVKDSDIMSKLIGDAGLTADVASTTAKHERIIQFDATDWDLLLMRADLCGMVVDVDDKKVKVVKPAESAAVLTLTHGSDIITCDLNVDSRFQYGGVTNKTWDMSGNTVVEKTAAEPSLPTAGNLTGKKLSDVLGTSDFMMHSVGVFDEAEIQSMADSRLLRSRLSLMRGKLSFVGHAAVKPNTCVELKGLGARFNGTVYVTGVHHQLKNTSWDTEITIGLNPATFAETQRDVMVPSSSGMLPGVNGLQIGVVKQIDSDPENETRILIDLPMVIGSGDGVWARQALYYGTNGAGNFFMPEIGDEVAVAFLNGDPRYPIIVGSLYSQKHPPAYTPDAPNTIKAITTNSKMKIEFEDVKKIITIWTPNQNYIEINDDKQSITILDETQNKMVMDPKGITWDTPKDFKLTATGKIEIKAQQTITMEATQDFKIKGLNVTSEASVANTMKGATAEVNGSGTCTIKGGMVMIN